MHLVVGAYRGVELVARAIRSLEQYAAGIDRITIVDDSGDWDVRRALAARFPVAHVVAVSDVRGGYNLAMQTVCHLAGEDAFVFWEEDFTLLEAVDFEALAEVLVARPYLAQLALLRGPHFAIEFEHGGVLGGLEARLVGSVEGEIEGVIEQHGTFTCNPAVWAQGIAIRGWPAGDWSEDQQRDRLVAEGFTFGFVPGVKVRHDGQRSGFGY